MSATDTAPDIPPDDEKFSRVVAYFAEGRKKIRGFLTDGAAAVITTTLRLQAQQGIKGHIAEIGIYHGKTFVGLALALRDDEHAVGVDLFTDRGEDFEQRLRENYRKVGVPDSKVRLYRGPSSDFGVPQWRAFLRGPARFIHIDGEHTRKAAYQDLNLAFSTLAPNGIILVDDVFHPWFPDVTLGVLDFLSQERDLAVVAIIDRHGVMLDGAPKLLLSRTAHMRQYRQALLEQMRPNVLREAQLDRHRPLVLGFDHGVTWHNVP